MIDYTQRRASLRQSEFALQRADLLIRVPGSSRGRDLSVRCRGPTDRDIQNYLSGGSVSVALDIAAVASPGSDFQRQTFTDGTGIRADARAASPSIYLYQLFAVPLRFIRKLSGELVSSDVRHSFRQLPVFHHAADIQIFDSDDIERPNELGSQLMQKVRTAPSDLALYFGNLNSSSVSAIAAFFLPAKRLLSSLQLTLILCQKFRVPGFLAIAGSDYVLNTQIDTDRFLGFRQRFSVNLAGKRCKVIANSVTRDRDHLRNSFYLLRPYQFQGSEFRKNHQSLRSVERPLNVALIQLVTRRLRSALLFEIRKLCSASKEVFVSGIQIPQRLSDNRAVSRLQPGVIRILLEFGNSRATFVNRHGTSESSKAERFGIKSGVIGEAGCTKIKRKLLDLCGRRDEFETIRFGYQHLLIIAKISQELMAKHTLTCFWTGCSGTTEARRVQAFCRLTRRNPFFNQKGLHPSMNSFKDFLC